VLAPFQLGSWQVQPSLNTISQNGKAIRVTPKVMGVLVCLAEHPGEAVSKDELLKIVWPSTFVTDDVLKGAISELRRVLEDDAHEPHVIETIPKRGYRLVAALTPLDEKPKTPPLSKVPVRAADAREPDPRSALGSSTLGRRTVASLVETVTEYRRAKRTWMTIAALLALGGAVLLLFQFNVLPVGASRESLPAPSATSSIHSLAVLPLQNLSGDPAQEYISDGMTDALITDLAQIGSVKVISRTSTIRFKKTDKSLPEIARELGVDGIIEGTVQRSGDRVLISAQLIYGPSDKHLWANSYERDTRDLLALEREVTQDIARQIRVQLNTNQPPARTQLLPMDPKALEAYLQGNYHLDRQGKGFGDEEKRKAAQFFAQAIATDPKFVPAYNSLALAHENLWLGSSEDVVIGMGAAKKAVEVDPNHPVAHVTLGAFKWQPHLDWRGAEDEFRHAISLDPKVAAGHSALGMLLVVSGRVEEGLRECKIAQRLDPFDDDSALCLYYGRDYDGSIAMFRNLLQADPDVGLWHCDLFPDYAMKGMHKEFVEELGHCFSLFGHPQAAANIQRVFTRSGYKEAVRQWAKEVERLQAAHQVFLPGYLAQAYTLLGDKDRAFYWLGQAYDHREMDSFDGGVFYVGGEPIYDPLRSDPRFKELLHRVGLPD